MSGTQAEVLKELTESAGRLSSAWADWLKGAGVSTADDPDLQRVFPWITQEMPSRIANPMALAAVIQEMYAKTVQDLPALIKGRGKKPPPASIKERWLREYEKLIRGALVVPGISDADRVRRQWKSFLDVCSGGGPTSVTSGLFPDLSLASSLWGFAPPFGIPAETGAFGVWAEAWKKTVTGLTAAQDQSGTTGFQEDVRRALADQERFLECAAAFVDQFVRAAGKAVERVLLRVAESDFKETGPDTIPPFSRIWISCNETAFVELFGSGPFRRSVSDMFNAGLQARNSVERVMAAGLFLWSLPFQKGLGRAQDEIRTLKERVRTLEKEIESLKRKIKS